MEYSEKFQEIVVELEKANSYRLSSSEIKNLLDGIKAQYKEITRLQSEARWIPVSQSVPEIGEIVMWTRKNWKRTKEGYLTASGLLKVWGGTYYETIGASWKPLPTPPTEG
jgi:hypothetical protein